MDEAKAYRPIAQERCDSLPEEMRAAVGSLLRLAGTEAQAQGKGVQRELPEGNPDTWLPQIVERHKGRIVFVDFWAIWCGPCRADLEHYTQVLHSTLAGLSVSYVYLCNRSSDEAWQTTRERLGMNFPEAVHYNLPAEQQSALERHLSVGSFPSHRLADATGHIIPGFSDAPHHPDFVREAVLRALGRE